MKQTDAMIIGHLRRNARDPLTKISESTRIPTSTVFLKLKELEQLYIKRYTVLLDYARMGYSHWMHLLITVHKDDKKRLIEWLMGKEQVNSLHEIMNNDLHAETIHRTARDYAAFIEELRDTFRVVIQEYQVIQDLKHERFLT